MANNYGAFSEKDYPKDNNYGAYQESRKVIFPKGPKTRKKASDTSSMNKVYKPKASPGPVMNTLNLYGASKSQTLNKYGSPTLNARTNKKSNFTYSAPKPDKAKPKATSKNVAGFKPGTFGYNAIKAIKGAGKDVKKAYQGK